METRRHLRKKVIKSIGGYSGLLRISPPSLASPASGRGVVVLIRKGYATTPVEKALLHNQSCHGSAGSLLPKTFFYCAKLVNNLSCQRRLASRSPDQIGTNGLLGHDNAFDQVSLWHEGKTIHHSMPTATKTLGIIAGAPSALSR